MPPPPHISLRACSMPAACSVLLPLPTVLLLPTGQAQQPKECERSRVRMSSIRRRLGLRRGGAKALSVVAMVVGSGGCFGGESGND